MAKAADSKPLTKTQIFANLADQTGLSKKQIAEVFDALNEEVAKSVSKSGPGAFTIPGLCKIVAQTKPATPKRKVRNPASGEMVWSGPKPARRVVKVRPLKGLKDMAE